MDRRSFIKVMGLSSLILEGMLRDLFAAQGPVVAVAEGRDHAAITRKAIDALGGMARFVKPGMTVVVKPNMGWDRASEYGANTNPVVVRAVVEECLKAGAKKVKVFDRTCNDERRCYVNSGIEPALKGMKNVEVKHIEDERFRKVFLNGNTLKKWELYDEALSADVFINVPVAKHHGLSKLTIGLKNIMGIMGGNRGSIHKKLEGALADVNAAVKSHLVIVDATRILTAHGPQGGDLADVKVLNKIIASTDIVAADAYATTLFGMKPADIPVTVAAYKRGLGEMNIQRMKIVKV
ncbi:DUF362 domain-containing protein [Geobacter sp. DSM 9736]|uniref:DUF362 domain-containing protein n=1 Tax=Geobacter sp. DSM 9736 TaxID=1277350 RepID=UPI000B50BEF7|nr:DUF362 domain-containing protein [Geobacter sp. DSM 9736]SNB46826.1 Uncharacterized conserved protein, DUF362 family [Geobacter sp. DSM 9736]